MSLALPPMPSAARSARAAATEAPRLPTSSCRNFCRPCSPVTSTSCSQSSAPVAFEQSFSHLHTHPRYGGQRLARCRVLCQAADSTGHHHDSKVGVVIVDHGSRKKDSNEMLVEFGNLYASMTGRDIVEIAHMEIAKPSIEDAIARCCERGATAVIIAPYFLSRGRHIQEDIPALVAEAQAKRPGLHCTIADPIGIDPLMAQLIDNRVLAALDRVPSAVTHSSSS